jgi:hypothetical protein
VEKEASIEPVFFLKKNRKEATPNRKQSIITMNSQLILEVIVSRTRVNTRAIKRGTFSLEVTK